MASIDPRIAMGIQPVQLQNPLEQYAQFAQVQGIQQRNKLAELAMQDRQMDLDQQNALARLYKDAVGADGSIDRNRIMTGAAESGLGAVIPKLQQGFAAQDKALADAQKAQREGVLKQLELVGQIAGSVTDQASFDRANQYLQGMGIPSLGPTYDAAALKQVASMALTRAQQLDQQWRAADFDYRAKNDEANRGVTIRGQNMTQATAIRGQNMTDARARESIAAGKAPAGYRWKQDGTGMEPIPGGPADKTAAATEGERKAATLLKRMEGSQAQLAEALKANPDAAKPEFWASLVGKANEGAGNWMTSEGRQRVEAAQLDILDAALTLGTGAAYTREQLEGYRKSYFPQVGDTPATVKDKSARLKNILDAAKVSAGRAAPAAAPAGSNGVVDFGSLK